MAGVCCQNRLSNTLLLMSALRRCKSKLIEVWTCHRISLCNITLSSVSCLLNTFIRILVSILCSIEFTTTFVLFLFYSYRVGFRESDDLKKVSGVDWMLKVGRVLWRKLGNVTDSARFFGFLVQHICFASFCLERNFIVFHCLNYGKWRVQILEALNL